MNEPQSFVDLQDAGNAQAQLILQAIARHANWDTGACWPGQEALARMAKCTTRTVRNYLGKLEADGFITRQERRNESGNRQSELITLVGYSEWITALREGGKVARPKSVERYETSESLPENLSPDLPEKIDEPTGKKSKPTGKQVSATKEHSLRTVIEPLARASARSEGFKSDFGSEGAKASRAMPCFTIQPADSSWQAWIDHLRSTDRAAMAFDAERMKRIRASTRWPNPESQVFEPKVRKASAEQRRTA